MKFLIVGDWHSNVHEQPVYDALKLLGHQVARFAWNDYFRVGQKESGLVLLWRKFQNKYLVGPSFMALNRKLVDVVQRSQPCVLFVYRGSHITAKTLREIRRRSPATLLIGYNNDDPFSPKEPRWSWRHFLNALPTYDLMLAYRHHNIDDYRLAGARRVEFLRSWFVPAVNHPVTLSSEDRARFECDVVFAGHNEPDGRLELLEEIVRQGFRLRLFGPYKGFGENGWHPVIDRSPLLRHLAPVSLVWGEDYNKALCGAKVAMCFLSKHNRDTYTRRCFEIPATQTMLFSQYTDDLATLYEEGREADFFRSKEELIDKLRRYVHDDLLRRSISEAGQRRVWKDGHDVVSRMRRLLVWIEELKLRI
jgi:spore maturation protein CgeB